MMHLSLYGTTFLLPILQLTRTAVGFSILPTTSLPKRTTTTFLSVLPILQLTRTAVGFSILPAASLSKRTTSTFLSVAAEPEEKVKVEPSLPEDDDALQKILMTLEKRVREGPGSLSWMEVEELQTGSDRMLEELLKKKGAEATAAPTSSSAPVEPAPVKTEASPEMLEELRTAVLQLDTRKVSNLLEEGLELDEATTNAAFWAVVHEVDRAEEADEPLGADVPRMLHHIFEADQLHLQRRAKQTTNVTCMQPRDDGVEGKARAMNYIFDDAAHKDLPLTEGRRCEGGTCCEACSRNVFPTFASEEECNFQTFPGLNSLTFNDLKRVSAATILQFMRLIERVRRTIAYEYGLPLSSILPLQAYSRKYVAGTTQQGGGGGEGDFVTLHTDEATHSGYHYSCVLYLSTQGEDFEGGNFVFNDPADEDDVAASTDDEDEEEEEYEPLDAMSLAEEIRRAGRKLTPFQPTRGSAVIFSSGWENMHEVETVTSGTRYTVPCFFTTCPVPEAAYDHMVAGKPKTDEDIADDWLHLLLAHRNESPLESTARVKELLMKWHYMCTPLSEH
jgi:hypothetical protein